ncbi:methyltransferase family protein [Costertonia aggregata]|uniref:Isoprenylcysteine carboxylmethyltransferase family protein n=1 Tax=Costertonia aggregata TaxID=343403 RepID=A0A7H9AK52_9FLAO|nr:isoprenylcysteine carboxylmethyltransferase family protein [Costertonia aggregata]QLG43901.1 isoprenylcysteine carboxylmethyltransferase family protein [Costertonia aggregata]
MELKLPPVFIFFFYAFTMYLLAEYLPFGYFDFFGRNYLTKILLAFAVIIVFASLIQFFRNNTTVDPRKPSKSSKLITNGVYAYSRNPMYLGMLLSLLAFGAWLGNAFNVLLAAGFVAYMNRYQIIPEERALLNTFGKSYSQYLTTVRRWF